MIRMLWTDFKQFLEYYLSYLDDLDELFFLTKIIYLCKIEVEEKNNKVKPQ